MLRLVLFMALLGRPHPIHSSSASITESDGGRTVCIALRVFADDFPPGPVRAAAEAYLAERFQLLDRAGRRLQLRMEGLRVEGVVIAVTLSAAVPEGLAGARVWHGVLTERFEDQVNFVQARYGGRAVSLLFTAGDGPKPLP